MAYIPVSVLFSTTPIDPGDTSGYPAGTKALGFGEVITSARLNRLGKALALNIEDVNAHVTAVDNREIADVLTLNSRIDGVDTRIDGVDTRIDGVEALGLDGVYRLGSNDVAGGGRIIDVDGAAVELRVTDATMYGRDVANATLRIDTTASALNNGSVGLDIISKSSGAGSAKFAILSRQAFTGVSTTNIPVNTSATLYTGGGSSSSITLSSGSTGYPNAEINTLLDLIQITGGTHQGVYLVLSVQSATRFSVMRLDNTVPVFTANQPVTVTLYRTRMATGSKFGLLLQEVGGQTNPTLNINTVGMDAISVFSGYGGTNKTFWVDKDGNVGTPTIFTNTVVASGSVTAGQHKYPSARTVSVGALYTNVEVDEAAYRYALYGGTLTVDPTPGPSGPILYSHLAFHIPVGATLQSLRLSVEVITSGGTTTIDNVLVNKINTRVGLTAHGAVPGLLPTNSLIANQTTNVVVNYGGGERCITMDNIGSVHAEGDIYSISIVFSSTSGSIQMNVDFPMITYSYDTLV